MKSFNLKPKYYTVLLGLSIVGITSSTIYAGTLNIDKLQDKVIKLVSKRSPQGIDAAKLTKEIKQLFTHMEELLLDFLDLDNKTALEIFAKERFAPVLDEAADINEQLSTANTRAHELFAPFYKDLKSLFTLIESYIGSTNATILGIKLASGYSHMLPKTVSTKYGSTTLLASLRHRLSC